MYSHRHFGEETIRKWHHPRITLEEMGLRQGMVFMDIGCGYGFFTIQAARIVGEKGRVYGVDIDASAIERLKRKASDEGLTNIIAKVGEAEEAVFCEECADIVFYGTVLHDFRDPAKVLRNAKQMIKRSGKLVDLDWKKKATVFGPPLHIRFSEEQAQTLITQEGFTVESVRDVGRNFYVVTAKP